MNETPEGLINKKQMYAIFAFIVIAFGITNIGGESCELGYLYGNGIYITHLDTNPEVMNLLGKYVLSNITTNWDTNKTDDFNGAYASLTEKPTDLNNFTNNAGYLKNYTETDPQVGAVTNGKWCGSNGTAINCNLTAPTATTPTIITQNDYPNYVTYFNEFNGDALDTYPITLGTQSIQSDVDKFGVYRWITGTTIGNDAGIGLGYSTTTTGSYYNFTESYLETRTLMASSAGYRMFIGFLKTSVSADTTTINAAATFFTNTSYGGAYWYTMCCDGAGASNCAIVNTTIARDTTLYHVYTVNTKATYAEFYIDGVLRANITSHYPKNLRYAYAGTYMETSDIAADNHRNDYIYFRAKRR